MSTVVTEPVGSVPSLLLDGIFGRSVNRVTSRGDPTTPVYRDSLGPFQDDSESGAKGPVSVVGVSSSSRGPRGEDLICVWVAIDPRPCGPSCRISQGRRQGANRNTFFFVTDWVSRTRGI